MIKKTLFFGNPVYLSTANDQMVIAFPDKAKEKRIIAVEDIGMVVLEDRQITITNALIDRLSSNNVAIVTCNQQYMPTGLLMNLSGHSELTERHLNQIDASAPLKKNLWQQTIRYKIKNQAAHLKERGKPIKNMLYWAKQVTSGDVQNHEARAAAYYWQHIFEFEQFNRQRGGEPPNNLLNYGYAILRSVCARALVGSGLLPSLGIHHKNKYNAYCLADDIMEPYRPFVDVIVGYIVDSCDEYEVLDVTLKKELLQIPAIDVVLDGKKSPLMVAMSRTTNSLYECYAGMSRKILYPEYG